MRFVVHQTCSGQRCYSLDEAEKFVTEVSQTQRRGRVAYVVAVACASGSSWHLRFVEGRPQLAS